MLSLYRDTEGISSRSRCDKVPVWFKSISSILVAGSDTGGDNIPTLTATFSIIMHVSTGADVIIAPSIEQSAMASGCVRGRGRGRRHDFVGGHSSFGGRDSYVGRQTVSDKELRQCKHCEKNNHIPEKC